MILRTLVYGAIGIVIGLMAIMTVAPHVVLGFVSSDIITAYEDAGVDVTECKKKRTYYNPSGDLKNCMQDVFKDVAKRIDEAGADFPDR